MRHKPVITAYCLRIRQPLVSAIRGENADRFRYGSRPETAKGYRDLQKMVTCYITSKMDRTEFYEKIAVYVQFLHVKP